MAVVTSNATSLNVLARVADAELASQAKVQTLKDTMAVVVSTSPDCDASCSSSTSLSSAASSLHDDDDESTILAEDDEASATSPIKYLEELFGKYGIRFTGRRCSLSKSAVPRPSFEEVEAYSMETALAVRKGDLVKLKELYYEKGFSLSASNRFGESLLHMCCRRGHAKMVEFMISEAKVNPRVIDDMGRTAIHDVCWSSQPNLETMDVLLRVLPPIGLLMQDCRGHTPLQYAPRKHWGVWLEFLQEREYIFVNWIRSRKERAAVLRKQTLAQAQIRAQAQAQAQAQSSSSPPPPRLVEMSPSA